MERKEKSIRWKKVGGGSFRLSNNKIVKPNEVFSATRSQIPNNFRDVVIPQEDLEEKPEQTEAPVTQEVENHDYYKHHEGGGWYHVYDGNDKQMTDQKLHKDAADQTVESLRE